MMIRSHASLDVTSIYFSDEIAISDELDLIIGGRLDDFELMYNANSRH